MLKTAICFNAKGESAKKVRPSEILSALRERENI
jgi:hypothetical protein